MNRAIVSLGAPVSSAGTGSELSPCHAARIEWTIEMDSDDAAMDRSLNITLMVVPAPSYFPSSLSLGPSSSPSTATLVISSEPSTSRARHSTSTSATQTTWYPTSSSHSNLKSSDTSSEPASTPSQAKDHSGASATAIAGANDGGYAGAIAVASARIHQLERRSWSTHPLALSPIRRQSIPGFLVLGHVPVVQRSFLWSDVDVLPGHYILAGQVLPSHSDSLEITVMDSLSFSVFKPAESCVLGSQAPQTSSRSSSNVSPKTIAVAMGIPFACLIACISLGVFFWLRRRRARISPFYLQSSSDTISSEYHNVEKRRAIGHQAIDGEYGSKGAIDDIVAPHGAGRRTGFSTSNGLACLTTVHEGSNESEARNSEAPPPIYPYPVPNSA